MKEGIDKSKRDLLGGAAATVAAGVLKPLEAFADTRIKTGLEGITPEKIHSLHGNWMQVENLMSQELPMPNWKEVLGSPRGLIISKKFHRFWLFDKGDLVKTYVVGTARPGYDTPEGKFRVAWEKGEDYSSQEFPASDPGEPNMPWAVFLDSKNRDGEYRGIAFHGSPQRFDTDEEGKLFLLLDVSHGCINATVEDAKLANETLRKGDPIVILP